VEFGHIPEKAVSHPKNLYQYGNGFLNRAGPGKPTIDVPPTVPVKLSVL